MTSEQAWSLALDLYPEHADAAAALIPQATASEPSECRRRAALALSFLDPARPAPSEEILALLEAVVYATSEERRLAAVERLCA